MRLLLVTLILVGVATSAAAQYVVLVGVDADDPYHEAASKLARHHRTKHVLRFDPEKPDAVLAKLREIRPAHVAVVLRPEQIHVNTARRILRLATQVDDDPFVDFEYGYITGATSAEAMAFVESIVRASRKRLPARVGKAAVWGGTRPSSSTEERWTAGKLDLPMRSLIFAEKEGKRDAAFVEEHLKDLEGCGALILGGHGMPWEIVTGPRAEDVGKLRLFPAVAFNYACHTGVTRVYPQRAWKSGSVIQNLLEIEAERSFALAMIRSGVVGYTAYVNPRPAGPEMSIEFARVLAGFTLGAARRNDYAKIVLGYLGFGEPGIVVPAIVDGEKRPSGEVDAVRHMMLDGATGGILYGDPAYRPFPERAGVLPLTTRVQRAGDEIRITLRLEGRLAYVWGSDPFRRFDEAKRQMAMKVYDRVALPEKHPEIRSVRVDSATMGGKALATMTPVWAIEEDGGKRYLHVKANFPRGGRGDVVVTLIASPLPATATTTPETGRATPTPGPGEPPPDFSKREVCLRLATEAGEYVLAHRSEIEDGDVYDGAAGVAQFLFDLHAVSGEERWLAPATELIEKALEIGDEPGLHTGVAGVGQVCLEAWRITKKRAFLDRARDCAKRLGPPKGTDVIYGAAGTGIFLLNLHRATKETRWLDEARKLGDWLAGLAVRTDDNRVSWPVAPGSDRVYIGLSHGAAGIGEFFVELNRVTKDPEHRKLAAEAAWFVLRCAEKDGEDGLKWTKLHPPAKEAYPVQWCHGSPGIGLFFLTLRDRYGSRIYQKVLDACIASNRRTGRTARGTGCQCHGIGGNAELFIEAWRSRKDPALLATAREWAVDLVENGKLRTKIGEWSYGPGYMTGMAGVGRYFLRLAAPEKLGMAFTVWR